MGYYRPASSMSAKWGISSFELPLKRVNIVNRGRQGLISIKKIKSNLLAAVLVLTVIPPSAKVGRGAIEHCYLLISQKLLALDEVLQLPSPR